jgi:cyclase
VLRELASGVYLETGYEGGNVGAILTERGVVLVDAPMLPPEARAWRSTVAALDDVIYGVVNTDYHPEHFLGNAALMPTRVWGHEAAARQIAKYKTSTLDQVASAFRKERPALAEEIAQIDICPPELTVGDRVTLHLGDREVQVLYLPGHTPASLGVYLPVERILFAGDNIVNNEHPTMVHANTLAWIDTLHRIQRMEVDLLVPGAGEPCGKDAIEPLIAYITEMRRRVTKLFTSGASRRDAVEKVGMLEYYPVLDIQATRIKRRRRESVERVYTEIRSAQRRR